MAARRMRGVLRMYESLLDSPIGLHVSHAHSTDRVSLPSLNMTVPRTCDWRNLGLGRHFLRQCGGTCWSDTVYRNLVDFGKLNGTLAYCPLEELRCCDYRSSWYDYNQYGCLAPPHGSPEFALQYVLRKGMVVDSKDVRVPLSGYIRIPPFNEEYLIRAIAQQPVIVAIAVGNKYTLYKEDIYEGEHVMNEGDHLSNLKKFKFNHVVNAIGYTDQYIIAEDSYFPTRGINGVYLHIRRSRDLLGTSGINCYGLIPYMKADMTDYNKFLCCAGLGYSVLKLSCFCDKDIGSVLDNPYFPSNSKKAMKAMNIKGRMPRLYTDFHSKEE